MKQELKSEEINVFELIAHIWKSKLIVFGVWLVVVVITCTYAKLKPDEYTSRIVYKIMSNKAKLNLGGVGSLLGVGAGVSSDVARHKPIIGSIDLYYEFIEKDGFLQELYPEAEFDTTSNQLLLGGKAITGFDAVRKLKDNHISISFGSDETSDEFIITCVTDDPKVSYNWLNLFKQTVVERILSNEIKQNQEAIKYYTRKLKETASNDLKMALNDLIIQEYKKGILIGQKILQVIEKPRIATKKSGPKRLIMAIVGSFFGLFLGIAIVFLRHSIRNFRENKNG